MKEFKLDKSPIVYYLSGTKHEEWVLFLHAAFVDHSMFKPQFDALGRKYNILAPDLLGHGHSTDARKGDSIHKMSAWISRILEKENIDTIHVVGISLGAVLAQDFANRYPGSVRSLACFGGYDINNFDPRLQKQNGMAQLRMMLKAAISIQWFAESNKKISAYTEQAQRDFYEMNLAFPKKSFLYLSSLNKMINARQTAPRGYPLLIGCGRHDIPTELAAVEQWRKNEPDCRAVIFEGAGHCVNMDVPRQFNETLEEFWTGGNKI